MTCSITDLPTCIVSEGINALLLIINGPIQPVLSLIKLLLTQPPVIAPLAPIWGIMVYVISLFYGLVLLWAGFSFIISGSTPQRRERAKEWLQNAVLMIVFVQASYYIYLLLTDLAAGLTTGVVGLIDPNFFLITIDNPVNVGFELMFGFLYTFTLSTTAIILGITYLLGSIGVVFFPIGLFLWFIPPLRDIGKYIVTKLVFILFLPFFASIILLTASLLAGTGPFATTKIMLAILAFSAINLWFIIMGLLVIIRSAFSLLRSDIAQAFLMVKGYFAAAMAVETSKPGMRAR